VLVVLAIALAALPCAQVRSQTLDGSGHFNFPLVSCAWPYLTTADELNVFYPDTNAKYWTTPYLSLTGGKLTIRGKFLKSRFLSINTYDRNGNSVDAVADKDFVASNGRNPYAGSGAPSPDETFQVTVVPMPKTENGEKPPPLPPGEIYGPAPSNFFAAQGYVILRSYVDNEPGGIQLSDLPDIVVSIAGHDTTVAPCTQQAPALRLLTITILERLAAMFASGGGIFPPGSTNTPEATFVPPATATEGTFPNDFNKYLGAVFTYQPGRIVVVRGKAATVPKFGTDGYPEVGTGEEMRYWSMCNNNHVFPYAVVDCKRDEEVKLDKTNHYTFVVATPQDTPRNAVSDPTVTLLDWGSPRFVEKALILRNMLPTEGFNTTTQSANTNCQPPNATARCARQQMRAYYPRAYYCQRAVFELGGWKACKAASGLNSDDDDDQQRD
jgi:hypothetical protein